MTDRYVEFYRLVRERVMEQERLVARMMRAWMRDWQPAFGEPVIVFDPNHDIVGLTTELLSMVGEPPLLVLNARDYPENPQTDRVRCEECRGTGYAEPALSFTFRNDCPVCSGEGWLSPTAASH